MKLRLLRLARASVSPFNHKHIAAIAIPLVLGLFGSSASQAASLDFGIIAPTGGTISYGGGGVPLIGSGIEVDTVVGLGTTANDNVSLTCNTCVLAFTTGGYTGSSGNIWNFSGGGSVTINGSLDFPDTTPDIVNGTLLSGTFTSANLVDLGSGSFQFQIVAGAFTDTKHPDLLDFYGLPAVDYVGGLNLSFEASSSLSPGTAFTSTQVLSGDVINQPVPVPAAVWLFGSGLLGLVGVARRKKQ